MKKTTTLLSAILFSLISFAQCPLTEAVDFTGTDVEGHEWNLFELLDEGKYVFIDFFFTTCGPCQATAPKVSEAYTYFGCNNHDVVILGIDTGNTDEQVIQFDETYGSIYPSISGVEGGGNAIVSSYQIPMFPTLILIAPDRTIVEQDVWPINDYMTIVNALEPYGIEQNDCSGVGVEEETFNDIAIYPNPAQEFFTLNVTGIENNAIIEVTDLAGRTVLRQTVDNLSGRININIDVQDIKNGIYAVSVISEGELFGQQRLVITK